MASSSAFSMQISSSQLLMNRISTSSFETLSGRLCFVSSFLERNELIHCKTTNKLLSDDFEEVTSPIKIVTLR